MKRKAHKLSLHKTTLSNMTVVQQSLIKGGEPLETHLVGTCAESYGWSCDTCRRGCSGRLCPQPTP